MEDLREVKLRVWGEEACRNNTLLSEDSVNTNFTLCAGYTSGLMSGCRVSLVSGNELFLVSFERSSPLACDICCQYSLIYYCHVFIYLLGIVLEYLWNLSRLFVCTTVQSCTTIIMYCYIIKSKHYLVHWYSRLFLLYRGTVGVAWCVWTTSVSGVWRASCPVVGLSVVSPPPGLFASPKWLPPSHG